jgi:Txe/YoeB family toxin of Txe-Axe toxin-antitoxin module
MGAYRSPETPVSAGEAKRSTPEVAQAQGGETHETAPQPGASAAAPLPALPAMPSLPPLPQAQASASTAQQSQNNNPLVASDEDVIEKEWVDKAKKIVAQTKTDPYTQEKEVSKLQADYIKKRYGKEIKLSSEQ